MGFDMEVLLAFEVECKSGKNRLFTSEHPGDVVRQAPNQ